MISYTMLQITPIEIATSNQTTETNTFLAKIKIVGTVECEQSLSNYFSNDHLICSLADCIT